MTKNTKYWEATIIVPILCYAFFLLGLSRVVTISCLITEKTYYITITYCCGLALNLLLNYYLINLLGYVGGSYALLFTFILIFALSYFFSQKIYKIEYDIFKIINTTRPPIWLKGLILIFKLLYYIHFYNNEYSARNSKRKR